VTIGGEAWSSFSEISSSAISLLFYSRFALASAPSTDRLDPGARQCGKILLQRIVENLPHLVRLTKTLPSLQWGARRLLVGRPARDAGQRWLRAQPTWCSVDQQFASNRVSPIGGQQDGAK